MLLRQDNAPLGSGKNVLAVVEMGAAISNHDDHGAAVGCAQYAGVSVFGFETYWKLCRFPSRGLM